jgi:hypothetical protein
MDFIESIFGLSPEEGSGSLEFMILAVAVVGHGGAADLLTFEQIASLFEGSPVSAVVAEHALAHGIETDKYDVPDVNVMDRSHAVPFVNTNQIPAAQGIVINDNQPYPVVGFVEVRRHSVGVVSTL